jgi:quinol monooxygenase YgiN
MGAMIGRIQATPGNRDALARALVDEVGEMPGCLSYLVAVEPADADGVWISECWVDEEAHLAWLASAPTRDLVERIAPLMVGYSERHELTPVGLETYQ